MMKVNKGVLLLHVLYRDQRSSLWMLYIRWQKIKVACTMKIPYNVMSTLLMLELFWEKLIGARIRYNAFHSLSQPGCLFLPRWEGKANRQRLCSRIFPFNIKRSANKPQPRKAHILVYAWFDSFRIMNS